MGFPWLFRGFFVALICLEKQCLDVFRGFFVAFPWLFRGPHFGQMLRVLALEKSSEKEQPAPKISLRGPPPTPHHFPTGPPEPLTHGPETPQIQ